MTCADDTREVCLQDQDVITRRYKETIMTFHNISCLTCWQHNIQLLLLKNRVFPQLFSGQGNMRRRFIPVQKAPTNPLWETDLLRAETFHFQASPQNVSQSTVCPIICCKQSIRYCLPCLWFINHLHKVHTFTTACYLLLLTKGVI